MTEIERLAKELVDSMTDTTWAELIALKEAIYPKPKRQEVLEDLKDFSDWWNDDSEHKLGYDSELSKKTLLDAIKELKKPALEWVEYDPDFVPDCKWVLILRKSSERLLLDRFHIDSYWKEYEDVEKYAIIE